MLGKAAEVHPPLSAMFCTCSHAVVWCRFWYSVCKDLNGMVRLSGTGWLKFVGKFFIFMTRQPGAYTLTVMRHFEKLCVIGTGAPTIWSSVYVCQSVYLYGRRLLKTWYVCKICPQTRQQDPSWLAFVLGQDLCRFDLQTCFGNCKGMSELLGVRKCHHQQEGNWELGGFTGTIILYKTLSIGWIIVHAWSLPL